ncbi:hypothetical protein [Sweetwater Branch virus]|uniref:Uncharacterized protein n=1 Tax=Sweetwater Branch virus TaxID=1272958 RepID=A0A0D3R123_9RHAB|nr:hypothetical protein [Sweetwater Branch virus]AJR28394.1 hypothetical protein [Sweetwater Branch virus]
MPVHTTYVLLSYYYDIESEDVPGLPISTICHSLDYNREGTSHHDDLEKVFLASAIKTDLKGSSYFAYIRLVNEGKICLKLNYDNTVNWIKGGDNSFTTEFNVGQGSVRLKAKFYWLNVSEKIWKSSIYKLDVTRNPDMMVYKNIIPKRASGYRRAFYASKAA